MAKIKDIAVTCRSKNASPFLVTLDIVFPDRETFEKVRASGVINAELISSLYSVPVKDVLLVEFPGQRHKSHHPAAARFRRRGGHRRLRRPATRPTDGHRGAGVRPGSYINPA